MKPYAALGEAFSEERSLIDLLLDEQRRLTAAERFARRPEAPARPAQERFYRDLIPLTRPRPGEQYAFEVNLDTCTGCKACVTACHALNGLEEEETWRRVGVLMGGTPREPVLLNVTTACHHCLDPGCLNGCPVDAYEKDPATGIVRHLDDQCIGCRYCVLKCPYDVPHYSTRLGIVRKCDMCHSRLTAGEAPACVQACPNGAITIRIVNQTQAARHAQARFALPDAPDPALTLPATRFVSARETPPNLKAGDHYHLAPAPAHPPLVWMLVLTQLSVGVFLVDVAARLGGARAIASPLLPGFGLLTAWVGMLASVLHLGRPLQAWRCFLGWRHSWLSREILALSGFGVWAALYTGAVGLGLPAGAQIALGALTVASGLAGVFASVMVYADTGREFWRARRTGTRFFGTTMVLGAAVAHCASLVADWPPAAVLSAVTLAAASGAKIGGEARLLRHLREEGLAPLKRSALLTLGELGAFHRARLALGVLGGVVLPLGGVVFGGGAGLALAAAALCLVAELCERHLFFTALASPRMPGRPAERNGR